MHNVTSRVWPKPSPACPAEQAETAQFPVRIAALVGQKEPVRRQMQNPRRAACLDARLRALLRRSSGFTPSILAMRSPHPRSRQQLKPL